MNVFDLPVFPPADVFPMMFQDELEELAADIKEHGLREPILVGEIDGEAMLIDGRNRREACRIAEVDPTFEYLNGGDPKAYVLSANIHRRHMTVGQRAMAVAMIDPEPEKGGRGQKRKETLPFSKMRLSQARTVLRWSEDSAQQVLNGTESLDKLYEKAKEELSADKDDQKLRKIRRAYPELADKVVEGELSLEAAEVETRNRLERERGQRANTFSHVGKFRYVADLIGSDKNIKHVVGLINQYEEEFERDTQENKKKLLDDLKKLAAHLPAFTAALKEPFDVQAGPKESEGITEEPSEDS